MPTSYQVEWIRSHASLCLGPMLDIGSRVPASKPGTKREYHSTRAVFGKTADVVGLDLHPGEEVDIVRDLSLPLDLWDIRGETVDPVRRFKSIYCLSVLEHVKDVFSFATNVERTLAVGGVLFVSVPWAWRYHGHPNDFWRMSPGAVRWLFRDLAWDRGRSRILWGADQKPLKSFDIRLTRPYIGQREKKLSKPATVEMLFWKRPAAAPGLLG